MFIICGGGSIRRKGLLSTSAWKHQSSTSRNREAHTSKQTSNRPNKQTGIATRSPHEYAGTLALHSRHHRALVRFARCFAAFIVVAGRQWSGPGFMSFYNGNSQIMTNICVIPCYGLYDLYSNTKAPVRLMCSPVTHPSPAARFPTKLLACLIHGLSTRMSPLAQEGSPVQKLGGSICYNGLITLMTIEMTVEACWDHGLLSLLPYLEVFCECSWKTSSWDGDGICEVRKCTAFWPRLAYLDAMRIGGNQVRGGLGSIPIKGLQPSIEAVCLKSLCVFFYTQDWTILKELLKQPPKTFRLEVDKEIWYPLPNVNCDWTRPKSSAEETTKLCFLGLEYVYRLL